MPLGIPFHMFPILGCNPTVAQGLVLILIYFLSVSVRDRELHLYGKHELYVATETGQRTPSLGSANESQQGERWNTTQIYGRGVKLNILRLLAKKKKKTLGTSRGEKK